jgi:hypothetical protein
MTVPEGVRCETCPFWFRDEWEGATMGDCQILPHMDKRGMNPHEACGHHPLWQEIARGQAVLAHARQTPPPPP